MYFIFVSLEYCFFLLLLFVKKNYFCIHEECDHGGHSSGNVQPHINPTRGHACASRDMEDGVWLVRDNVGAT